MRELRLKGTTNYYAVKDAYREAMRNFDKEDRINGICCEGGSRSGKTWSISMFICELINQERGNVITISRDFRTTLTDTTYKTFEKVWLSYGMPSDVFNQRPTIIKYNGNTIRFVGINDNIGKAHGMEQDILWINESMFVGKKSFDQMEQRTSKFFILDYNPSEEQSWNYDVADKRPDVKHIVTTFLNNPMAPKSEVRKIKSYNPWHPDDLHLPENERRPHPTNIDQGTDSKDDWIIYGEGKRGVSELRIFNFEIFESWPDDYEWKIYGVDFGFSNDVSTVCEVRKLGNNLYVKELIYEAGLVVTSPRQHGQIKYARNLADEIIKNKIDKDCYVVCDNQQPGSIKQLRLSNINAMPCTKGKGSIKAGIDKLKGYKLHFHVSSMNLQTEARKYKWMVDKTTGAALNLPVDKDNHLMDAMRYAATKYLGL